MSAKKRLSVVGRSLLCLAVVLVVAGEFPGQKLPLKVYTAADGLASSVIHNIIKDSDGFLWFAARGGLTRYDGNEFVVLRFSDAEASPLVHYVLETRDGRYFWIATDRALYRVERGDVAGVKPTQRISRPGERYLSAETIGPRPFWSLYETRDGRIFGGSSDGLFEVEDPKAKTVTFRRITYNTPDRLAGRTGIRGFAQTSNDELWVASDAGFVRALPDGRWVTYEVPRIVSTGNEAYSIRADDGGRIWVTFRSGVFILKPEPAEYLADLPDLSTRLLPISERLLDASGTIDLPERPGEMVKLRFTEHERSSTETGAGQAVSAFVQDLIHTSDGKTWIPSAKSLYVIDGTSYRRLRDLNGLPGAAMRVAEDANGDIWFGTFGGVIKYVRDGLTSYTATSGLVEPTVHKFMETGDGRLLVSHGLWHMSVLNGDELSTTQLNLPRNSRHSWTSFPTVSDSRGTVWALSVVGLYRFPHVDSIGELGSATPQKVGIALPTLRSKVFYRAFNDSVGRIWFSMYDTQTRVRSLFWYDPGSDQWEEFSALHGFPTDKTIASFAEDRVGNLWFGFYDAPGLLKFTNGRLTEYGATENFPGGSILALQLDREGRLWFGSNEAGVGFIEDPAAAEPVIVRYTENEGLSSNNVRCLAADPDGRIYAGTVRGVTQIDRETGRLNLITTEDGLAGDFVHTAHVDSHGTVWFGTSSGLSRLNPGKEIISPASRATFITHLRIAGETFGLSGLGQQSISGIELDPSENNLQIGFTAVGNALRFQHKLEGSAEEDWQPVTAGRTVDFANLAPGNYRFLVRAVSADGNASDTSASVLFRIAPPIWQRWWFLLFAFGLVSGATFALDRYRVLNIRKVKDALALSRESETRFRTLADTASDAILTIDEQSTVIFVNGAVEKIFGYAPDEIVGQRLTMLMPESMISRHESGLQRYLETGRKNINWTAVSLSGKHKDGHEIPLELSFGEFTRHGKRYFTGIARDISERLASERALQKVREERFRELERVRSRIATDLHDDIGSSLTQIAVLSEVARGAAGSLHADQLTPPLDRIKAVSKELVAVMSDVVWAINPQKDHLHDLIQRMRRFGSDIFTGRGIAFEFTAPELEEELQLGANIRREVFAIFKEAATNVVKYSGCTAVKCEFRIEKDYLILKIADNGSGFDTEFVLSEDFRPEIGGNGLVSMRRRAVELGGLFSIDSKADQGTRIFLRVPLAGSGDGAT